MSTNSSIRGKFGRRHARPVPIRCTYVCPYPSASTFRYIYLREILGTTNFSIRGFGVWTSSRTTSSDPSRGGLTSTPSTFLARVFSFTKYKPLSSHLIYRWPFQEIHTSIRMHIRQYSRDMAWLRPAGRRVIVRLICAYTFYFDDYLVCRVGTAIYISWRHPWAQQVH